jgi:hypothetical protein
LWSTILGKWYFERVLCGIFQFGSIRWRYAVPHLLICSLAGRGEVIALVKGVKEKM